MRKIFVALLDTETCNSLDCPLMYNIAVAICDLYGNIYAKLNFIISDVFYGMPELMTSCYYAHKIPEYEAQIQAGEIEVVTLAEAVKRIRELCKAYNVAHWCAHNARFDNKSMNTTERYITKSRYRYIMPKDVTPWDTMKMAQDVIATKPTYRKFCEENGYMTKHAVPRPQVKAETIYRFITQDKDFTEEHKAFEDAEIEVAILAYCVKQHKKMRRDLWDD